MDWRIKGAIQKVLGYVPGGGRLHYMLQRRGGGLADFSRECDIKVDDWRLMMGHLRAVGMPPRGATLLEIGTGWYPTFPLCLYLAGAARVHTLDLTRHLKTDMTAQLADRLESHVPLIARESGRDPDAVAAEQAELAAALARGEPLERATGGVIDYRAPADAARTGLPAASVDVVFSNSVLEHVPGPVIEACFAEAMRILRPGGIVFHSVNCGDHYAYADRSIDQLHYLQFSDTAWRKWNNEFLYQNRLRAADFTRMAVRAGFAIEVDTSRASPERLAQLANIRVDPALAARYSREQLAITSIDFVGRKPG
ncbi:MAG TPA: class I SAM-dependent methyltransferase [Kofleriaceae bacterium]|nr:class I SAM-dependent methyltransferase [Kofleriaceae bacterium]